MAERSRFWDLSLSESWRELSSLKCARRSGKKWSPMGKFEMFCKVSGGDEAENGPVVSKVLKQTKYIHIFAWKICPLLKVNQFAESIWKSREGGVGKLSKNLQVYILVNFTYKIPTLSKWCSAILRLFFNAFFRDFLLTFYEKDEGYPKYLQAHHIFSLADFHFWSSELKKLIKWVWTLHWLQD